MYVVKTPLALKQTEMLFLVDIYKNMPNYHRCLFLHTHDILLPLPLDILPCFFGVYKVKSILVQPEFPCPWKICWDSCLHLPPRTATLALLTGEAVVEAEPAVFVLSSVTDYYLHSIIHTVMERGMEFFQT